MPSSNANLVAATVTDKNGVQAIRWKRPEAAPAKKVKLPAVKPPSRTAHMDGLRKDFRPVSQSLLNITARLIKAMYRREDMLSQLAPDSLNILNERYGTNKEAIGPFLNDCVRNESCISINNAAALIECSSEPVFTKELATERRFFKCVSGLRSYENQENIDYSVLSEKEREIGRALIVSAAMLDPRYRTVDAWKPEAPICIKSEHLVDLIRRRPVDHLLVVSILAERGYKVDTTDDIETLETVLNESTLAPLRDGAL